MLSENDKQNLLRNLARNRVVLATGAGFSADAVNISGNTLPVGDGLARHIWKALYPSEYEPGTSLKTLYAAAMSRMGKASLRDLLNNHLKVSGYPGWYGFVTQWFWRRIYTFNADDLMEQIFAAALSRPALETIVAPAEYAERDSFLRSIQYIKLHGSISDPRDLTFGPREYGVRAAARTDIWYLHFIEDYSTLPTVFIGTQLDEPLFWQYVELRGSQVSRGVKVRRPKCYVVSPRISKPDEEALETYNIVSVRSTAQEFFIWLNEQSRALSREDVLRLVDPTLEPALVASERGLSAKDSSRIEYFFSFFRLPVRPVNPRSRPMFLLGNPPTWEDIAADLDAPRQINDSVRDALVDAIRTDDVEIIVISSAAGGGKSTICKRAALELIDLGYSVYFSEGETSPDPERLSYHLASLEQRCFLFFDNAGHDLAAVASVFERAKGYGAKPVIVVGARSNDIAFNGHEFGRVGARVRIIGVPHLSDADINSILDALERHDLLGSLREKSHAERVDIFRKKARKQILVAMREATSGKGFDEIIENEFASVRPAEAQLLYLIAALASDDDYGLTVQQMITAMGLAPPDTQALIEKSLAGILTQHEFESNRYFIRHPAIAHFVIESAPRVMLADAVNYLLITISTVLPPGRERRSSRAFRLYRHVLNHHHLNGMFPGKSFLVRKIYEEIKDYYREDGHYWLQYGSFETEYGGDISLAENYIAQASALLPANNRQVETATAHLLLKKALTAPNAAPAAACCDDALKILRAHMRDRNTVSLHALHIFGSQMLQYVMKWVPSAEQAKHLRDVHDELRRAVPDHLRTHPELGRLLDELKRAELETTIPKPK